MAARVTDDGQRVVLGANRDVQRAVADPAAERGGQVADAEVDGKSRVRQGAGRPRARLLLFELQFGVRVDPMAERDELLALTVDGVAGRGLQISGLQIDRLRVHAGSVPP